MYHYQQLTKDPKEHLDDYHKMSRADEDDQYSWLAKDDPRRHQTDAEILYEKIDLKDSALTRKEKTKLMKMILKYRDAFSLRDEIGECPNLVADIKVIDESPFFVRPFPLSETRQTIYGPANGKVSFLRDFDKEQHKPHFSRYAHNKKIDKRQKTCI